LIGIPLWVVSAYFAITWWFNVPSPGKAIGALATVAGIMSVREMKVSGKIAWSVLLVLMLVTEFHAIDKDRKENDAKQKEFFEAERADFQSIATQADKDFKQTTGQLNTSIAGLTTLLNTTQKVVENVTGGDSYAYVYPDIFQGGNPREFSLKIHNAGQEILTGVTVRITRIKSGKHEIHGGIPGEAADEGTYEVGSLAADVGRSIPNYWAHPVFLADGTAAYLIFITAQNGGSVEDLYLKPSKDGKNLAYKIRVYGPAHGKKRADDVMWGKRRYRYVKISKNWIEPIPPPQ
jgi:hypothetical protein